MKTPFVFLLIFFKIASSFIAKFFKLISTKTGLKPLLITAITSEGQVKSGRIISPFPKKFLVAFNVIKFAADPELTNTECPKTDGISFSPSFLCSGKQENNTYMYWELGPQRAVRKGDWKAYRDKKGNWELYDLSTDIEEQINLAHKKDKVLNDLIALAESSHQPARLGKIINQALVDKDRREAPHERNLQFKKSKK